MVELIKMLMCEVALIVFVVSLTNGQNYKDRYVIPKPKIEVFSPKGFRVSIEDSPGVSLFAFHGNINRELRDLEAGTFSRDILHKQDGRWTFEDRSARLRVGDTINYWLFVIKSGLGYRLDDGVYKVTELLPTPTQMPSQQNYVTTTAPPPVQSSIEPNRESVGFAFAQEAMAPWSSSHKQSENEIPLHLNNCEQSVMNITESLRILQTQISELIKTNEQLTQLLQNFPNAKKLTFSGRIPPDGEAVDTASFLLKEKLDLNPHIVSAVRNADRTITFEVATIGEKLDILEISTEKLKNSRIILS